MRLVRTIQYVGPVVLLSLLFAAPALAQFEVSPDHFDNSPAKTGKKPAQKAKTQTTQQVGAKKTANVKSSTSAATVAANSTNKPASQPSGEANSASTAANVSSVSSTKRQNQGKIQSSRSDQHLNAKATPVPRE